MELFAKIIEGPQQYSYHILVMIPHGEAVAIDFARNLETASLVEKFYKKLYNNTQGNPGELAPITSSVYRFFCNHFEIIKENKNENKKYYLIAKEEKGNRTFLRFIPNLQKLRCKEAYCFWYKFPVGSIVVYTLLPKGSIIFQQSFKEERGKVKGVANTFTLHVNGKGRRKICKFVPDLIDEVYCEMLGWQIKNTCGVPSCKGIFYCTLIDAQRLR